MRHRFVLRFVILINKNSEHGLCEISLISAKCSRKAMFHLSDRSDRSHYLITGQRQRTDRSFFFFSIVAIAAIISIIWKPGFMGASLYSKFKRCVVFLKCLKFIILLFQNFGKSKV